MGSDSEDVLINVWSKIFQFTLPCGERPTDKAVAAQLLEISIHAPVWGATDIRKRYGMKFCISIHAPVWGATIDISTNFISKDISIHAPVWGAT